MTQEDFTKRAKELSAEFFDLVYQWNKEKTGNSAHHYGEFRCSGNQVGTIMLAEISCSMQTQEHDLDAPFTSGFLSCNVGAANSMMHIDMETHINFENPHKLVWRTSIEG